VRCVGGGRDYTPGVANDSLTLDAPPLAGRLLVARPEMGDPTFSQTVILMLNHGPDGALGIILNRPTDSAVGEVLGEAWQLPEDHAYPPLHVGGPCPGPLMALHDGEEADVRFTSDQLEIAALLMKPPAGRAKFITGYAGWGPGQLEAELAEDAWLLTDPRPGDAFGDASLWQTILTRLHVERYVRPDQIPPDASVN
jgi:putative transcriptional regulator